MSNNWPEPYNAAILLPVGTVVEIAERTLVSTVAPVSLQASAVKMFKRHCGTGSTGRMWRLAVHKSRRARQQVAASQSSGKARHGNRSRGTAPGCSGQIAEQGIVDSVCFVCAAAARSRRQAVLVMDTRRLSPKAVADAGRRRAGNAAHTKCSIDNQLRPCMVRALRLKKKLDGQGCLRTNVIGPAPACGSI